MIVYDKEDYDSTSFIKPSKCFTTTFVVILLCLKTFLFMLIIYLFFANKFCKVIYVMNK